MRKTFIDTLTEISRNDEKVMCVIGDTGFSVFEDYEKEFKERFVNVGIAEQNFIGFGAGLAAMGMKPVLYNVCSFMAYRAFEQIELDICYQENPVILVGVGGGHAYGPAGPTHHAYFDVALMRQLPNMIVICPGDPIEMREAMYAAYLLRKPIYIRIGRSVDPLVHKDKIHFEIGKAIIMNEGEEAIVVANGTMLKDAKKAVEMLAQQGINCGLASVHTVKPIDKDFIQACSERYKYMFTVEEHSMQGGLGSAIEEVLNEQDSHNMKLVKMGFPDQFASVTGDREYLNSLYGLSVDGIVDRVKGVLEK